MCAREGGGLWFYYGSRVRNLDSLEDVAYFVCLVVCILLFKLLTCRSLFWSLFLKNPCVLEEMLHFVRNV